MSRKLFQTALVSSCNNYAYFFRSFPTFTEFPAALRCVGSFRRHLSGHKDGLAGNGLDFSSTNCNTESLKNAANAHTVNFQLLPPTFALRTLAADSRSTHPTKFKLSSVPSSTFIFQASQEFHSSTITTEAESGESSVSEIKRGLPACVAHFPLQQRKMGYRGVQQHIILPPEALQGYPAKNRNTRRRVMRKRLWMQAENEKQSALEVAAAKRKAAKRAVKREALERMKEEWEARFRPGGSGASESSEGGGGGSQQ